MNKVCVAWVDQRRRVRKAPVAATSAQCAPSGIAWHASRAASAWADYEKLTQINACGLWLGRHMMDVSKLLKKIRPLDSACVCMQKPWLDSAPDSPRNRLLFVRKMRGPQANLLYEPTAQLCWRGFRFSKWPKATQSNPKNPHTPCRH